MTWYCLVQVVVVSVVIFLVWWLEFQSGDSSCYAKWWLLLGCVVAVAMRMAWWCGTGFYVGFVLVDMVVFIVVVINKLSKIN